MCTSEHLLISLQFSSVPHKQKIQHALPHVRLIPPPLIFLLFLFLLLFIHNLLLFIHNHFLFFHFLFFHFHFFCSAWAGLPHQWTKFRNYVNQMNNRVGGVLVVLSPSYLYIAGCFAFQFRTLKQKFGIA